MVGESIGDDKKMRVTKNDFITTRSTTGYYTVRWKISKKAVRTRIYTLVEANNAIKSLVKDINKLKDEHSL